MPNIYEYGGLIEGLNEAVGQGLRAYQEAKKAKKLEKQEEEELSLRRKMIQANLAKEGLLETPEGLIAVSPEAKDKESFERALKSGQSGVVVRKNKAGEYESAPDPRFWRYQIHKAAPTESDSVDLEAKKLKLQQLKASLEDVPLTRKERELKIKQQEAGLAFAAEPLKNQLIQAQIAKVQRETGLLGQQDPLKAQLTQAQLDKIKKETDILGQQDPVKTQLAQAQLEKLKKETDLMGQVDPIKAQLAQAQINKLTKEAEAIGMQDPAKQELLQAQIAKLKAETAQTGKEDLVKQGLLEAQTKKTLAEIEKLQKPDLGKEAKLKEIARLEKEIQKGSLKGAMPAKMATEARVKLGYLGSALNNINNMEKAIMAGDAPRYFGPDTPIVGRATKETDFEKYLNLAAENYGRFQSGGAITKEEEARFKNLAPRAADRKDKQRMLDKIKTLRDDVLLKMQTLGVDPEMYLQGISPSTSTGAAAPQEASVIPNAAASSEKIIGGKRYRKVRGGWEEVE